MSAVLAETVLGIARLPALTPDLLELIEGAIISVTRRDGTVSIRSVQAEMSGRLATERLEPLFFTLAHAGILTGRKRDRRGHAFDQYQVNVTRLHQIIHDATVARYVLEQVQAEQKQGGQVELIATLPDNLPLDSEIRRSIASLAAALHRLITEAEREIIILNPFFEQAGFDRLASALLAAARRGTAITIISHRLTDPTSTNHTVMSRLVRRAAADSLNDRFSFYEYQQGEAGHIVLASHAKVLLADGEKAYIGSANLTEYGMARRVEIGVLLQGPQVKHLRLVLKAIMESQAAQRVYSL